MRSKTVSKIVLQLKEVDFMLLVMTLILALYGLVMVFSASYYFSLSENGNPAYYLLRDGIWVIVGTFFMFLAALIDYRKYNNFKFVMFVMLVCLVLLVLVLTPVGSSANDATRWLKFGPVTIMPGEIAKAGMILLVAWFYSKKPKRIDSVPYGILPIIAVLAVFMGLIVKQPNLSTAVTLGGIVIVLMLVAGMRWAYVFLVGAAGVVGVLILIFTTKGYFLTRFMTFTHPFDYEATSGYQIVQGLLALGSGGLGGVGLGQSVTKSLYLPYPHNDFILAIIGEETGFIGILILFVLYTLYLWRVARVALKSEDQFGLLLAAGVALMVGIQVILNVAVVTSSMPATGVNLPFVSYGGNALIIFMFMSGLVMNISRHIPKEDRKRRKAKGKRHESDYDRWGNRRPHISGDSYSGRDKETRAGS